MDEIAYTARAIQVIDNSPRGWNCLRVGVFEVHDGAERQVGQYQRNYPSLFRTFYHFRKNNRDYALYSRDYSATRVMELPSCKDIGGEEPLAAGFCPADFYVPWKAEDDEDFSTSEFGFVAGCVWGDDGSWKIQFLDLSEVESGTIKRDERFGYIVLPEKSSLEQAISLSPYKAADPLVTIASPVTYNLQTGKMVGTAVRYR